MKYFVTGTGTDVGKTLVSAILAQKFGISYFKPIQSGIEYSDDVDFIRLNTDCKIIPSVYRFKGSLSPNQASEIEDIYISLDKIFVPDVDCIVEGAGGLFVPLNRKDMMIDLIKNMNLPVIVVSTTGLGTINYSLLTIKHLESEGVNVAGIIFNGDNGELNIRDIVNFSGVKVIGRIGKLPFINREEIIEQGKNIWF